MKTPTANRRSKPGQFHHGAYIFVQEALKTAQELVGGQLMGDRLDECHHITGQELLEGVRVLALRQFGLMAPVVFLHWGVHATDDFGRIVFELIDKGTMRKSETDQLSDFHGVYLIDESLASDYKIDVSKAFRS